VQQFARKVHFGKGPSRYNACSFRSHEEHSLEIVHRRGVVVLATFHAKRHTTVPRPIGRKDTVNLVFEPQEDRDGKVLNERALKQRVTEKHKGYAARTRRVEIDEIHRAPRARDRLVDSVDQRGLLQSFRREGYAERSIPPQRRHIVLTPNAIQVMSDVSPILLKRGKIANESENLTARCDVRAGQAVDETARRKDSSRFVAVNGCHDD
jgi:hypothetical protein